MRNLRTGLKATLCLILFNSPQLQAANVNFPDQNLADKVRDVLKIPDGNAITTDALENLTELHYNAKKLSKDQKVKDIEGLQHAPNLRTLNLLYHEIESIEQIAGLTNLQAINFYSNLISDITPVAGLSQLKTLAVGRNQISDISVVADLPQLTQLQIHGNQVTDSTPIHGLTDMLRLYLGTNEDPGLISDISFVANMTKLTHFYAQKSNISDISALANAPGLNHVYVSNNDISSISPLAQATSIKSLFIDNNGISDLSPISEMVNMEYLSYSNNPISSHNPVSKLDKLIQVWFINTNASSVDHLAGTTNLWYANIQNNAITNLTGLKDSVNIEQLYMANNEVSDLSPLQTHNKLRVFYADNNEIADISPLGNNPALRDLQLRNNVIEDASPLGTSTALWRVWLNNNLLTTIGDWSNLSILFEVSLNDNLLTDISTLGNCTTLTKIYAHTNQITTIGDWSNLTKLMILNLERNQITDLDSLATATNLTHILFGTNQVTRSDFIKNLSKLVYLKGHNNQISKLDYLDNLTGLRDFYMQNNKIRGDITLPDGLSAVKEFFVQNNFITSITNLDTLEGLANTQDDFHAYNNYLDISDGSEVVAYKDFAFGINENEDPKVLYQPQYNPNGDRDKDGIHDAWEIHNWTEPLIADSHLDPDGDLYTNLEEYEAQTDPQDADSFPTFPPTAIFLSHNAVEENQDNSPLVGLLFAQDIDSAGGFETIAGDMHWDVAMDDALESGGYLATITSPYEQRMVVAAIPENRGTFNYWIGGSDTVEEGVWQWVTGEPFTYTNWLKHPEAIDEPNGGTLENFIELKGVQEDGDRPWNDEKPNVNKGYILELNPDFALVAGDGDANNDLFTISGNELKATQAFDFETTTAPLSIRVKVTDRHDLTYEQILEIEVADVNESSTDINLSTTATPEDRPAGSLVSIIFTTDPDKTDQFTYALVDGSGSNDNASFTIEDNKLLSAIILDRETQANYQVRIRSTDAAGHEVEASFTIEALDMPENTAPTEITISSTLVKENEAAGTTIATLNAVDPDANLFRGGIGTYSLVFQKYATFAKAQILAERKSGHLAAITSEAEWDIMINQIGLDNLVGKIALLGATDAETEGEWTWITGEPFSFENWGQGQPSNAGGEHHLEILGSNDNGDPVPDLPWNDIDSEANPRSYYILEQPMTYELAAGRGDTDNHRYQIIGNRLVVTEPSDFETLSLHRILIRVTDVGGLSYETNLVLSVQDGPDAPVGITLDKTHVAENLPIRSVVANLSAIDQDADERHFFTLVSPSEEFYVSGTQILTLKPLDFEQKSQYTLTLQVSDKNKLTYQQDVLIEVTDANDIPTDIQLSNLTVEENAPAGTEIGTITASDPDEGDTHIFQVVGGTDKAMFRTLGDKLTTSVPIDFEAKPTLEVIIRAIDSKKGILDLPFTIDVIDMNDGPTDLHISQTAFPENLIPGSVVLDLSTTDQDPAFQLITESFTWEGAYNDAESRGGHLATFASQAEWDRMVQSITLRSLIGLDIWLGATDEEDEGTWKWVDDTLLSYTRWANPIYVEGLEDFPPDNLQDAEHHLAIYGATSKRLEWNDFPGETALGAYLLEKSTTYKFVEGKGSTHNDQFKIIGSQLLTVVPADFETNSRYFILIEATDPGGLTYQKTFQLTVTDAPDAPTAISLSTNEIPENQPRGYQIATLSAQDQDINEFFSYTLIDPPGTTQDPVGSTTSPENDNALFYIKGNILYANQPFDYEDRSEFTIHVQVKDRSQLTYDQSLDLIVTNGNDTPTAIAIDSPTLPENQPRGTVIGNLTAEDPDPNERHTFTVVGGRDQDLAYAKGTTLFANAPIDYETKQSLDLIVQVSDIGRATAQFPLTIEIRNENDVPTDILLDNDTISENEIAKLISHWDMDGDGWDSGPAGNDGQLVDDAHFVEGGKTGWALKLDGDKDTLHIPQFFGVEDEPAVTISAWIKLDELPTDHTGDGGIFVSDRLNIQNDIALLWVNFGAEQTDNSIHNNVLTYNIGTTNNINNRVNSSENIFRAMEWQHVVGITDGTMRKVYIDGQLVGESNIASAVASLTLQDTAVDIGAGPSSQHFFEGMIDDVRLYATALSDEQVQILYNDDLALDPTPTYVFSEEETEEAQWAFGPLWLDDPDDVNIILDQTEDIETLSIEPTFELVAGIGDDDNHLFKIDYDMICPVHPLNYEVKPEYSVRVRGTDAGGLFTEKVFTFKVTDASDAPDGIYLDNNLLSEDSAPGSTVGILSTFDEDDREKHIFTLVPEELDVNEEPLFDNDYFQIQATKSGVTLKTAADAWFDFETRNEYHLLVEVTDKDGLSDIEVLTVMITDANDVPHSISIDNAILSENMPRGTIVGTLSAEDQDHEERHTFQVVGGPDQSLLIAKGNILSTNAPVDFETMPFLEVIIAATDSKRGTAEFPLIIHIKNENDAPTDIYLDNYIVEENQPAGTHVGLLEIIDEDFAEIIKATAGNHSLFLLSDGSMYSMGRNNRGQLGDGTNEDRSEPVQVFDAGVMDIAAGVSHSLCVMFDGSVWTFGSNSQGELGDGTNENRNTPTKIMDEGAYAVWAGASHSLVLMEDGSLYTFGSNGGALGDGTRGSKNTPVLVVEEGVIDVAAKGNHSAIIKDDGSLWTFGQGGSNGDGTNNDLLVPTKIVDSGVILIAAGGSHTLFVKEDGSLWATGTNNSGQLGNGNNENQLSPVQIEDSGVVFVEARASHSLFIKEDGSLWGMGSNRNGQLGVGDNVNRNVPTMSEPSGVIYATAGVSHSLFIKEDASLWGMGANSQGQLGDGTTINRNTPVSLKIVQPTYELVEGVGSTDNAKFAIQGKQLLLKEPLDFEGQFFYEIRVKATDIGGLSVEQTFLIETLDAPDAPTAITLSENEIPENAFPRTIIGIMEVEDADDRESHTIEFIDPDTTEDVPNDNALFLIVNGRNGATLTTGLESEFDYESRKEYTVHVMVTDKDGLTFSTSLDLMVTDENDEPTSIFLTNHSIEENMRAQTTVGKLYAGDIDANQFTSILSDDFEEDWVPVTNTNWKLASVDINPNKPTELLSSLEGMDIVNIAKGDNLQSVQHFGDAIIQLEFLAAEGANSGVYVQGSYEIQIFDSFGEDPVTNQSNGAIFGVNPPLVNASKSFGEWQQLEIHFTAPKFEEGQKISNARFDKVLLNGQLIHELVEVIEPTSQGTAETPMGPLVLQGTFGNVAFRNVLVRSPKALPATFTIVGGRHANLFLVKRDLLLTAASFDYEGVNELELIIEATDSVGESVQETLNIHVTNANEVPTDIVLDSYTFEENQEIGTILTNITVEDPDPIHGMGVYELIKGHYSWTEAKADAEARGGHLATVTSSREWAKVLELPDVTLAKYWLGGTDAAEEGNWQWITGEPWLYEPWSSGEPNNAGDGEHYTTTWADNSGDTQGVNGFWNDLPENATLGYIVEYKHSFKLAAGRGGEDNDKFTLVGNQLISNAELNFEVKPTLNILLEVTDPEGLTYQKAIFLQLTDTPDAPTGVMPMEVSVNENTPANTFISDLTMIDEDAREKHLIEFAEAPEGEVSDNEHFTLSKGRLMTLSPLDYETQSMYELYVQGTDKDGLTFATWVPVHIQDVNDAPTAITLVDPVLEENTTLKIEVGQLVTTDPDEDLLSDDIVAYFGFNEGKGVFIKDSAPAGNHGTLHNPDPEDAHWVDGKFGKGLLFAARGKKVVEIPHIDAYMLDEGTFTLWCNPKVINSAQTLFSKDSTGTTTGGHIYLSLTDQFYPKVRHQPINAETTVQAANTNTAIADEWNHLAVSFGQKGLTIHLNGEIVAANVNGHAGIGPSAGAGGNPEPMAIGANTGASDANSIFPANGYFEGIIDEFFIYNRQLSKEEVADLASAEAPPIDTTAKPPYYAYLLVPGEGDDQNDNFYIKGDKLFSKLPLDYETAPEVSVRVKTTDSGKLSHEQVLTFELTDVNDAPTDVLLDNAVIAENEPAGTLIGSLSSVDEDVDDSFPEDFSKFEIIEGDFTWEEAKVDAESKGGHLATITSSVENDVVTSFLEESSFSFNMLWIGAANSDVLDEFKWATNEPWNFENWDLSHSQPDTDLANSGVVIVGDQRTNSTLFSWHDAGDSTLKTSYLIEKLAVPYQLVSGTGDTDNALFTIVGDELITLQPLNFEAQQTYSIRVKGMDEGGLSVEKVLTISAIDQPDEPEGITLSNDTLPEDAKPRTVIGTFVIMDEDDRETHTVELVEPDVSVGNETEYDNDLFTITVGRSGSTLDTTLEATFDYEEQAEHLILVKVTDKDGLSFTQELVVKIADANDKPSGLTIDNDELEENLRQGTQIGQLLVEDQDHLDRHTFLVSGGRDRNKVYLKRDLLYANEPIDFETQTSLDLLIRVTDLAGAFADFPLEITILNANDTPTDIALDNNVLNENEPAGTVVGAFTLADPDGKEFTVRTDVISVATRGNHSLFLKEDGSVWATGQNHMGQLGDGTTKDKYIPVQVIESGVTAIAAGRDHSLFLMEDGSLWGTGNNFHGQLGTGVMEGGEFTFDARIDSSKPVMMLDSGVAAVAAGEYHTLILKEDGSLWATGYNFLNQLGDGSRHNKATPVEIMESGVTAISGGAWHSLILMEDGSVWTNGFNQNGQIGDGTQNNQSRPVKVINSGVVAISAGASHNLVVNSDGSVWAWGSNANGQFGNGTTVDSSTPISVINKGVVAVSAGFEHSLILKDDSSLWAAGKNDRGQLGDGTLEDQLTPVQVVASEVTSIHAGAYHSMYLLEDMSAWVSGKSLNGQLGDGSSGGGQFTFDEGIDKSSPLRIFESVVRLTSGIGDTDNHLFTIIGGELRTLEPLNFEEKEVYSIRVRGTDPGAAYFENTFTITVIDQPDAPTDIALDNYSIHESTPGDTNVANFLVTDEDARETFTFEFSQPVDGPPNNNDLFTLVFGRSGVTLATAAETTFDYEEQNQYSIHILVTDKDGLTYEKTLQLNIVNAEEPPTDIEFGEYSLVENLEIDTEVGTFLPVDEDLSVAGADSHTFFLVTGEGDTNNSNFRLDRNSGVLTTSKVFDYESDVTQSIRVKVTDSAGFSIEKSFSLDITNANDAPTALTLTPDDIIMVEQLPAGTLVGTLSATDIDTDDPAFEESFLYTLSFGEGNTHNDHFEIVDDQVLIKTPIVHADIPVASFHVTVADKLGAKLSKAFTITILDRNDAPTAIALDNNSVRENLPFGTLVGNLSATDPDTDDTHIFKLVSGDGDTGNASFFIQNGNQVVTNALFDFEEQTSYSIRVEASDEEGATFSTSFSISITDEANEVPRFQLIVNRIPENGGLTTGAGLHEENSVADLTATAGPGYTFAGWTGDLPDGADSGDALLSVTMDSDKTINAFFARSFHTVDVAVYPDRHGYANGGGSILSGSEITVTAEELSGEDNVPFSHWRVNGEDLTEETDKSLTLTVEDDLEVEAVFDIGLPDNFVLIPAGTYVRDYKGKYEHTASVSAFYTTTHETTKGEWYKVYKWALQNGYKFEFDPYTRNGRNMPHNDPAYDDDYPISGVSWDDMLKWCNARAEMEGWMPLYYNDGEHTTIYRDLRVVGQENSLTETHVKWRERGFRLPTELEWERAARGGIDFLEYPNGNTIDETQAFFNQSTQILSLDYTTQSDRVPNGFGLYDMAGNAWEACWDWYSKYWYENPLSQEMDTKGPNLDQTGIDRNYRTARGGSSFDSATLLKIGIRPVFRTWYNYAITLRPVFPAPTEPDATITLASSQAHLGDVSGGGVYKIGSSATLRATPDTGAAFTEWQDADGNVLGTSTSISITAEENMTIYAVFEDTSGNPPLYTLLTFAEPRDNGTVTGTGAYLADSTIEITATPIDGLDFAGWSGDAFGTDTTMSVTITKNMTITGAFGDTSIDTDRDGLSDLYEEVLGSSPYESDSDGDKLLDGDEVNNYGSNPTSTDTDGDGHDDRTESLHRTSLTDPNDFPFIATNDLARYFTFRGQPYDYSGNKGHGTFTDITLIADRWFLGKNAYSFNGTSSFVEATGYSGVSGSSARAIAAWVRTASGNSGPVITYGTLPNAFDIQINDSGVLEVVVGSVTLTGSTTLSDEGWHQFLVTVPEGGTVGDVAVYIDGQPESTTANGDTSSALATATRSSVLIGKDSNNQFFTGDIDDVRLWERVLAASEAEKLYDQEVYKEPDIIKPNIVESPAGLTVAVGDTATFTVSAKAKPEPTYTWQKLVGRTWQTLKGADTETLTLTNAQEADAMNYRVIVENSEGIAYSRNARLIVLRKPSIVEAPPAEMAFLVNRGGRIYAYVDGSPKITYEWFKDGESLGNSRGNFWYIPSTANQAEHGGVYSFKVTNPVGEISSEDITVSIIEAVIITEHPASKGIISGESGNLSVTATGGGTLTYQWQKYDSSSRQYLDVDGATEATYTIDSITANHEGIYQCEVTNGASTVYSGRATLSMFIPPAFTTQPRNTTIEEYDPVTLSSLASGDPTPLYMWQKFNTVTEEWEDQIKYQRADFIVGKTPISFAGKYRVKATNDGGVAISDEVDLIIHYKPLVTQDLVSITANEDTDVTLTLEAEALDSRGTDITYKWFHNNVQVSDGDGISGTSTNSVQLTAVDGADGGTWYCKLSNTIGETQARAMKLLVIEKPYATTTLSDLTVIEGNSFSLSVGIRGSKPFTFQWYKDGQAINGATLNKLYISPSTTGDSGEYTFEAENPAGKVTQTATVTVTSASTGAAAPRILAGVDTETPDHDADGDGLNNLLEQALGSDPANPDSTYSPTLDIVEDGSGQQFLSFHYTQNNTATDLLTIVEVSTDLITWEPLDLNEATLSTLDRGDLTETTVYLPADQGQRFIRIRVEK